MILWIEIYFFNLIIKCPYWACNQNQNYVSTILFEFFNNIVEDNLKII